MSLGELQTDGRVDDGSAIPGGLGDEGVTNVVGRGGLGGTSEPVRIFSTLTNDTGLTEEGYPVTNGSSFIMTVEYGPNGPEIRTILTYGQTGIRTPHCSPSRTRCSPRSSGRPSPRFRRDRRGGDQRSDHRQGLSQSRTTSIIPSRASKSSRVSVGTMVAAYTSKASYNSLRT